MNSARARHFASIVWHSDNAILAVELDGTVVSANPAAERAYGRPASELIGGALAQACLPELQAEIPWLLERLGCGEPVEDTEVVRVRDGRRVIASLTLCSIYDEHGEPCGASVIARDVTEAKETASWLAAQQAVTAVLGEADALEQPLRHVLAALGERLDWEVVNFWEVDARAGVARCATTWTAREGGAREFVELSHQREFVAGQATPGRVWASAEPVWIEDFGGQEACVRGTAALAGGLRGALGLPIVAAGEVLGVLECLSSERMRVNHRLTELMCTVSTQIGQFLERRRTEDEHTRKLEAVIATRALARTTDARSARDAICEVAMRVAGALRVVVFEPQPDGAGLRLTGAAGAAAPRELRGAVLPFEGAPSAAVTAFSSGELFFASEAADHPAVSSGVLASSRATSILCQPVVSDGRSIAVLVVHWDRRVARLDRRLGSLMEMLAAEASLAFGRADLLSRLEEVARTDELTGLANRREWDERVEVELARAAGDRRPICVAIVDIDHFKAFNDEHGHQAGDRLLREAAAAWRSTLRERALLARYGGEEFALVLPDCRLEDAHAAVERLRAATPARQSCSAGIAAWNGVETAEALVGRADSAVYSAKRLGRDRTVMHERAVVSPA